MSMFKGIGETKVTAGGAYFEPGLYLVEVTGVKMHTSDTTEQDLWIVETKVLESSNPKIEVGSERSQVVTPGKMFLPNVKAFVAAASGVDPMDPEVNEKVEAYWSELCSSPTTFEEIPELIVSEQQPLVGVQLGLECVMIKTKAKKQDFTKHKWHPIT